MNAVKRAALLGPVLLAALATSPAHATSDTAARGSSSAVVAGAHALPFDPFDRGYRDGFRQGVRDGRKDCSRSFGDMSRSFHQKPNRYTQGYIKGYKKGYFTVCDD